MTGMASPPRTNSTKYLGEVVQADRLCRKCNYSLKGLHAGGLCPECGTPIPGVRPRVLGGDNLSDAPVRYLWKLSFGLALAVVGMIALCLGLLTARSIGQVLGPVHLGIGALLWNAGVWIFASPRPLQESTLGDPALDQRQWLLGLRIAQCVWLLPVIFGLMQYNISQSGSTNGLGFAVGGLYITSIIAFLATVPVLAHLNALATWAGDESLAARIHSAGWGIGVCGILGPGLVFGSPFLGPVRLPASVVGAIFMVLLGGCLVIAVISVVQIASISFLAISSNAAAEARDARVAQKRAREAQERHQRQLEAQAAMPAPPPIPAPTPKARPGPARPDQAVDVPLDEPGPSAPTYRVGGYRIEDKGSSGETYELAPDDPD